MNKKKIKNFNYIFLKDDGFSHKKDTRKRNDIIIITFSDGSQVARIYLNNVEEYVDVPNDKEMLNELSHITWTKDSNYENGTFVKSDADETSLNSILKRYKKDIKYKISSIKDEKINTELKEAKRKAFINKHPYSNTEYAYM